MRRILITLACFATAFSACSAPASAEGKAEQIGAFANADTEIDIYTYADVDDKGTEVRVAAIKVQNGQGNNVAAFDADDWPDFVSLIHKAEASQSSNWQPIGEFVETGTTDVSHVRVSAGPGIRLVVESPAGGAFTAELPASRFVEFEAALSRISDFLKVPR